MHQYKTIAQTLLTLSALNLVFAAPVAPRDVHDTGDDATVLERRGVTTPPQYPSPLSPPGPDESPPHDSLPLDQSALLQDSARSSDVAPSSDAAPLSDGSDVTPPSDAAPPSHLSANGKQVLVPVHDWSMEPSTSSHPLSATNGQVPVHDSTAETSTSTHPLSLADEIVPVPDSVTGASTSSHPPSEAGRPASAHGPTAVGSTTTQYTAVTYDMVSKGPKFYQKPMVKKLAGPAFMTAFIGGLVIMGVLRAKHKDD